MCCFSKPVEHVEQTRIFARRVAPGRQALAYQMKLKANQPVAMILPIPVPANSPDDAVRFISLEGYPTLFADLAHAFPPPPPGGPVGAFGPRSRSAPPPPLVVHSVGAFVASFVPSQADFTRLDPRFRVPAGTIDRVPEYRDWGFAVFQLAFAANTLAEVHPMAFEFPTRYPDKLFFPTVHVHDGALHPYAGFAHTLYAQGVQPSGGTWLTVSSVGGRVDVQRSAGLVDGNSPISRLSMFGTLPNQDIWV
jgi:hypothetical protein